MGRHKYQKMIKNLFKKSPVVDADSIRRIIKSKKQVRQYDKQLIRNLILNGSIKKLGKGFYTIYDDPSLAVFSFSPAYLGLQDALSFHGLWEQETIPVIITSKRVRAGIRKIMGSNILIRRIKPKYLFGFEYYKNGEFYMPYTDLEKTVIDIIYFNEALGSDTVKEVRNRINIKKFKSYLNAYPKKIRGRALGLLKHV